MSDEEQILVLCAFLRACGYSVADGLPRNVDYAQHLVYLAQVTEFPAFEYDFAWERDLAWPSSADLLTDLSEVRRRSTGSDEVGKPVLGAVRLPERLVTHLKDNLLPLCSSGARTHGAQPWAEALSKVHFMVTRQLNSVEEAVDVIATEAWKWCPSALDAHAEYDAAEARARDAAAALARANLAARVGVVVNRGKTK